MSRTTKYKLTHLLLIGGGVGTFAATYVHFRPPVPIVILVVVLFLLPSRIQGLFWRDFFRGRRLLDMGDTQSATVHLLRFLEQLRERPGLRHLIWLSGSAYTRDVEAMALNNLGAARMQQGDFAAARTAFEHAIRRDSEYPLPFFNLAQLARATGQKEDAEKYLLRARALGYSQVMPDRLLSSTGALLARIEGIGSSAPGPGHCIHCGYDLTGNASGSCPECGRSVNPDVPPSS